MDLSLKNIEYNALGKQIQIGHIEYDKKRMLLKLFILLYLDAICGSMNTSPLDLYFRK